VLEVLIGLTISLVALAVIGHGLWLMAAGAVRLLTGEPSADAPARYCPRCNYRFGLGETFCPRCSSPLKKNRLGASQDADELVSAARLMRSLFERGHLDEETVVRVERVLFARRDELLSKAAATPPVPAPAPVPVVQPEPAPPAWMTLRAVPVDTSGPILEVLPADEPPVAPPVVETTAAVALPPSLPPKPSRPVVAPPPEPPPKPRRSLADVLTAFMEESNILWGELVGGLLIVGCSVALVISLWHDLEKIPYSSFLLFSAITAALFGAGEYTLHHWKLQSTSRGLLIIALLLTPLNLLVLGDPTVGRAGIDQGPTGWGVDLGVKLIALLGFTALARRAGRDLLAKDLPRPGMLTAVGVIGAAAGPLLGSTVTDLGNPLSLLFFGGLACAAQAFAVNRATSVGSQQARAAFSLTGIVSFAAGAALGFLVSRSPEIRFALHNLGQLLPLTGSVVLLAGLRMQRALADEGEPASGGWRTVATAVGGAGLTVMLAGIPLAWPQPGPLAVASLSAGVLLSLFAFRDRRPALHAAALPCLALAALLGVHFVAGHLPADNLALLLASPESGTVLAACVVVLTALSEVLIRISRPADANAYALAAVGAAMFALTSVTAEGLGRPELAAAVYGTCAASALAANYRWRRPVLAYAGLGLAVGASLWASQWAAPGNWPVWTFVLGVEAAFLAIGHQRADAARSGRAWRDASVVTGALAVALMATHPVVPLWYAATCLALAVATLSHALAARAPAWFALCQCAVTAAALFAVDAWLRTRAWTADPVDPRALQAYGVGLGGLALAWVIARLTLRSSPTAATIGLTGFTVDRVVLAGLVIGQFVLALVGILPGLVAEMARREIPSLLSAWSELYGPGARLLLGVLAVVLALNLRERGRTSVVLGLTVLAFTVPVLVAGPFFEVRATTSALRWALAASYLVVSALVWSRRPLARLTAAAGVTFRSGTPAALATRFVLNLAALAVLALTAWLAALSFAGRVPNGPLDGSFFARIGWTTSALVPLAVLVLGLTGHAVRERSPEYAFAAGFVADLALAGGHALAIVTAGNTIGESEGVRIAQLATFGAAVWGIAWMLLRRRVHARELPGGITVLEGRARPLLALQLALAIGGNLVLLGGAVAIRGNVLVERVPWSLEAGSPLGAATLLSALGAFAVWHWQRREPLAWQAAFFVGLTLPVLLACAAERAWIGSGSRVLLLAWPGYVLLWSLSTLRPGWRRRLFPGVVFEDGELPFAVALVSLFTIFVAARTISVLEAYPLAAAAAVLTALSFATLAVARRSEGLAFVAALLGNVAVSLLVVQHYRDVSFELWAASFARVNAAASAVAALAWLAMRRWLREPAAPGPLLAVQAALGLAVNTIVLLAPFGLLLVEPGKPLAGWAKPDSPAGGWLALVLATAAAVWHCQVSAPSRRIDVLGIFGLSAGVLVACAASPWDTGNWLSYHLLSASWAALGMTGVAAGSIVYALHESGLSRDPGERQVRWFAQLVPASGARRWVEVTCGLLALLAFRGGWTDPYRPYPSAATLVLVAVMTAALAMWFRRARHVWASGLALNLAGIVLWLAWGSGTQDDFLLVNAIGLAIAATFWTAVGLVLPRGGQLVRWSSKPAFAHVAAFVAWMCLLSVVALGLVADLASRGTHTVSLLDWSAAATIAVCLAVALRDRSARWPAAGLYGVGLAAIGLALQQAAFQPGVLARAGTLAVAGYALFASVYRTTVAPRFVEILRLPPRDDAWFAPVQLAAAACVAAAGGLISINLIYPALDQRLAGAAAVALVVPAVAMLGPVGRRMTLVLTTIVLAEVALAIPDPFGETPWLSRTAWLVAALTTANLLFAEGIRRAVRSSAWAEEGQRAGAVVGILAVIALLALLGREFDRYNAAAQRSPMQSLEILVVAISVLALTTSAIRCAVVPGRDSLGLPERGRTVYVYGAEVLLVLLVVHLRMTAPELFSGWVGRYWTLLVMLLGFLGMGLSELFERNGVRVLAEPLRLTGLALPAVPLTAYWIGLPLVPAGAFPTDLGQYAVLWLSVALLYGLAASMWRSMLFGLLSALALNFGLWSLLQHGGFNFRDHLQVWLIPLALIVLVAEFLNRERLPEDTATGLRYLGICMIYISSTADLFIAGIGNSVILPVVLATLAVCGVLAGISLRVRAFLFLGVGFLLLDVMTMIWHAAVNRYHTWVWWVSGIVLGVAILALFALFEKRRNDVLRLIDEIRRWD
jgi:hypothetical protein